MSELKSCLDSTERKKKPPPCLETNPESQTVQPYPTLHIHILEFLPRTFQILGTVNVSCQDSYRYAQILLKTRFTVHLCIFPLLEIRSSALGLVVRILPPQITNNSRMFRIKTTDMCTFFIAFHTTDPTTLMFYTTMHNFLKAPN